ncbi:MAG: hypothetical protein PHU63_04620, partial [Candidatus ainarchaeum sp.]|nr:hypothetical protein [Candidatus ainarchaeum sp.]
MAFGFNVTFDTTVTDNYAYEAQLYAFGFNNSIITFTGNNTVYYLGIDGYEVQLENSTLRTGSFDIITENLSFGLRLASNVSIKVVDLDVGINLTGIIQSSEGNYYGLNVTNTSSTAVLHPRLFYNASNVSDGYVAGLGKYNDTEWSLIEPSYVGTLDGVPFVRGIASEFSCFAPMEYISSSTPPDSSSTPSTKTPTLEKYSFNCLTGEIQIKASYLENPIYDLGITLSGTKKYTDNNGIVSFTI